QWRRRRQGVRLAAAPGDGAPVACLPAGGSRGSEPIHARAPLPPGPAGRQRCLWVVRVWRRSSVAGAIVGARLWLPTIHFVEDVVIVAAARTPFGKLGGGLSSLTAPELGATVIREVLQRAKVDGAQVEQVIMGTVLTAGMGQMPARQAALTAELPTTDPTLAVDKGGAHSLKAAIRHALPIS